MNRIQSLGAFWPVYLSEHQDPRSRLLHFIGTSLFFASVVGSVVQAPVFFPIAAVGMVGFGWWGSAITEPKRAAFGPMLGMVLLAVIVSPILIPAGVFVAYACAWVGHFRIEHNRPATFKYPMWSFLCDLRMWSHMARGRLWRGNPLEELRI